MRLNDESQDDLRGGREAVIRAEACNDCDSGSMCTQTLGLLLTDTFI